MPRSRHLPLEGSRPAHPPEARAVRPVHDEERAQVAVVLTPGTLADDHPVRIKADGQDGAWPGRQPRLSREEMAALNAPREGAVDAVLDFARRHDLDVVEVSAARHDVILEGPVAALNRAFRVEQRHYEHAEGSYRAHDEPIHVPEAFGDAVQGVLGLDDIPSHRPDASAALPSFHRHDPVDLASHYRFPRPAEVGGQRIALLEFAGGFDPAELEAFVTERGLAAPVCGIVQVADGRGRRPGNRPLDPSTVRSIIEAWKGGTDLVELGSRYGASMGSFMDTVEVTMDAEIVAAMAPGVPLDVVFAPSSADGWRRALYGLLGFAYPGSMASSRPSGDRPPTVISISWGKSERAWGGMKLRVLHEALDFARRAGVTVCCSSGDWGSHDSPRPTGRRNAHFPASSPAVLACGGTSLVTRGGVIEDERAWKEEVNGVTMASGGGMSGLFRVPDFQASIHPPDPVNTWLCDGPIHGRWIPDVAATAGFAAGIAIRVAGEDFVGGGTSAATPLWAALVALLGAELGRPCGWITPALNQVAHPGALLGAELGRPCGWITPALYQVAHTGALVPVSGTDNDLAPENPAEPRYRAGKGWDPCTGLGIPDGTALLEALRAGPPGR